MNSLIPHIPLDLFLKIWGSLLGFDIVAILSFSITLLSKIKDYKEKLKKSANIDPDTEIPYLKEKGVRKLLKFDDKKRLIGLGIAILIALIFGIIYTIFSSIGSLSSQQWYKFFVSICSWMALFSALVTIAIAIRLYIYVIQLWSRATRR